MAFPFQILVLIKKVLPLENRRGHQFQLEGVHRLGNASHIHGLDQDRLSCLLHIYKNALNDLFYCLNLPISSIKQFEAVQHLESGKTFC